MEEREYGLVPWQKEYHDMTIAHLKIETPESVGYLNT
jgi:hypothetical protein